MRHEAFDIGSIDVRSLNLAQRQALQRRLVRQAHGARTRAIGRTIASVFVLLCRLGPAIVMQAMRNTVSKAWTAHIRRRDRLEGVAQLRAMNDQELRDIALPRSGIKAAVFSDERDATLRNATHIPERFSARAMLK